MSNFGIKEWMQPKWHSPDLRCLVRLGLSFLVTPASRLLWLFGEPCLPPLPTAPQSCPSPSQSPLADPHKLSFACWNLVQTAVRWSRSTLTPFSLLLRSVSVGQAARPRGGEEGRVKKVEVGGTMLISILEMFPSQMGLAVQLARGEEEGRVREAPSLELFLSSSLAAYQLETWGTRQSRTTSAIGWVQPRRLRPSGRCVWWFSGFCC